MTSMREKIARAVWERRRAFALTSAGIVLERFDEQWGDTNAAEANDIYGEVDAVLDALMEPTEGMLGAFHQMCDDNGSCLVKPGYQAMIIAAKEGK